MDTAQTLGKLRMARYYIEQQRRKEAAEQEGGSNIVNALDSLADAIESIIDRINE